MPAYFGLYKRKSVLIEVFSDHIEFNLKDDSSVRLVIDYDLIEIEVIGKNQAQFLIRERTASEKSIVVQGDELLRELQRYGVRNAVVAIEIFQRKNRFRRNVYVISFSTLIIFIVLLPQVFSRIPGTWINAMVSHETAKILGKQTLEQESFYSRSSNVTQAIEALVDFLVEANPQLQEIPFEVYVSKSRAVNAFAAPGAILIVNQGLLQRAETVEEVMGVLAHELAHLELRHNIRSVISQVGIRGGVVMLNLIFGSEAGDWIGLAPELMGLKYSREFELDADSRGYEYLRVAGVSATGAIQFFEKLMVLEGSAVKLFSIIYTHPLSEDRISNLRRMQTENPPNFQATLPVKMRDLKP